MNRIARTTVTMLTTLAAGLGTIAAPSAASAAGGDVVYIDGIAYEDGGVVALGDAEDTVTTNLDETIDLINKTTGGCIPKSTSTTIYDPAATVYYGTTNSIYVWEDLAEAEITGCPNNTVTVKVQMVDQALNGTSLPATSGIYTGTGKAKAGAIAELMQRYSNLELSTGLSLHQLTTSVASSQTDGKTTTAWCAKKSWTYLATLGGPVFVGSTPTERVKCG